MSKGATIAILGAGGAVVASAALLDPAALEHPTDALAWYGSGMAIDRQTGIQVLRGGRWVSIDGSTAAAGPDRAAVAAEIGRLARARWGSSASVGNLIAALIVTAQAESAMRPDAGGDLDATGRAHAIGLWQLHDGLGADGRVRSSGAVGYRMATYQRRHPATAFSRLAERIEASAAVQSAAREGAEETVRALTTAIIRPANPAQRAEERVRLLSSADVANLVKIAREA